MRRRPDFFVLGGDGGELPLFGPQERFRPLLYLAPDDTSHVLCVSEHTTGPAPTQSLLASLSLIGPSFRSAVAYHASPLHTAFGQQNLTNLLRLDISSNSITKLPISMRHLAQLQNLEVEHNPLQRPPADVCLSHCPVCSRDCMLVLLSVLTACLPGAAAAHRWRPKAACISSSI